MKVELAEKRIKELTDAGVPKPIAGDILNIESVIMDGGDLSQVEAERLEEFRKRFEGVLVGKEAVDRLR